MLKKGPFKEEKRRTRQAQTKPKQGYMRGGEDYKKKESLCNSKTSPGGKILNGETVGTPAGHNLQHQSKLPTKKVKGGLKEPLIWMLNSN